MKFHWIYRDFVKANNMYKNDKLWFECVTRNYIYSHWKLLNNIHFIPKGFEMFYHEMQERLRKFNLELSMEKTNIILFSRYKKNQSGSFEFLGFEFRRGKSHKGGDIIKRRTSRKKLKKSIKNFTEWFKKMRNKRLKTIFKKLNSRLRGYYNYYGLINNGDSLKEFFNISIKILYKWLNRRSQRRSMN